METMTKRALLGPFCLAAWALAACATTTLTSSWKDESYSGGIFRKVLIVGVSEQPRNRRIFEDEFAARLQSRGVETVASYRIVPTDGKLNRAEVQSKIQGRGFDAVVVVSRISERTETIQHPGRIEVDQRGGWHGHYSRRWEGTYMPPTTTEYQVAVLEANVYDPRTDRLIWTGSFETEILESVNRAVESFVLGAIKSLEEAQLIE